MTHREFCFWLDGFFSLESHPIVLNQQQFKIIQNHLNLVNVIDFQLHGFLKWLNNNITSLEADDLEDVEYRKKLTQEILHSLKKVDIMSLPNQPFNPVR